MRLPGSEPLTRDEEVAVARAARAGDDAARSRLVMGVARLATNWARSFAAKNKGRRADEDDLFMVAMQAATKAVDEYDPERGIRFGSWVQRPVFWAMRAHVCAMAPVPRSLALDAPIPGTDELTAEDLVGEDGDVSEVAARDERALTVARGMVALNEREQFVVKSYYGIECDALTLDEIGDVLGGITRQRVSQIIAECLPRMRRGIERQEEVALCGR